MSVSFELDLAPRSDVGKGASRRLRRTGQVPVILYGGGKDPEMLQMPHNVLMHHLEVEAFYSHILTLKTGAGEQQAVLKDLQRHPSRAEVLHMDLFRVSATGTIRMHVPIHFLGEDVAPGVKLGGGGVSHQMADVEVACQAKDLPEFIEADLSEMQVGDTLHLSDLKLPQGVEIVALTHGSDHDLPVAAIHAARVGAAADDEETGEEPETSED